MFFTIKGAVFTDIITNSSSVVYTWAASKENLYNILDEVLAVAGSKSTAKDLFDIYIVGEDLEISNDEMAALVDMNYEDCENLSWHEQNKLIKEMSPASMEKLTELFRAESDNGRDGYLPDTMYKVYTKEGKESPITKYVANLFDSEGSYNG